MRIDSRRHRLNAGWLCPPADRIQTIRRCCTKCVSAINPRRFCRTLLGSEAKPVGGAPGGGVSLGAYTPSGMDSAAMGFGPLLPDAWPLSCGTSGKRAFFVSQAGDLFATDNLVRLYSSHENAPDPDAVFAKGQKGLRADHAHSAVANDGQTWKVIN